MHKFLIIEDDEATRFLLNRLLTKNFECMVFEAADGAIGMKMLHEHSPDIILLDISMPVMDGLEALSRIRSYEIYKNIPVMVITAINDSSLVSALAYKGITEYILKPIDTELSVERIKKMINKLDHEENMNGRESNEHILIVDPDSNFKSFFTSLLGERFNVHEASTGADGLELYIKHNPRHVFVCNKLSMLDKKILTQKIREIAEESAVSIYLMVTEFNALSTKVFTYDGIIHKSTDKDKFLHEIKIADAATIVSPAVQEEK